MPCQRTGQPVQPGEDHALADIELIQQVAHVPADFFPDDIPDGMLGMLLQIPLNIRDACRNHGEEGILIHDALINGRRFQIDKGIAAHIRIVLLNAVRHGRQRVQRKDEGLIPLQYPGVLVRQVSVHVLHVEAPNHTVPLVQLVEITLGVGKMQGYQRGARPVHQTRRKPVVLPHHHLLPDRRG